MEKRDKLLIGSITVIYSVLILVVALLVVEIKSRSTTITVKNVATKSTYEIDVSGETTNPIVINIYSQPFADSAYVEEIMRATSTLGFFGLSRQDAAMLCSRISYYAAKYDLDLPDAFSLVYIESNFDKDAESGLGAVGLCQIMPLCLAEYNMENNTDYTLQDMFDIDLNLEVGFWYFNRLMTHYGSNYCIESLRDAYLAYNAGPVGFCKNPEKFDNWAPAKRFDKITALVGSI
jgi:hypothetical protein